MKRHLITIFCALHLVPATAGDRDPLSVPMREWLMLVFVTIAAGLVSWLQKVRRGEARVHDLTYLIGELACSVFAGLVTWALLELASAPKLLTIAMVAISGHLGARAIQTLERWGERQLARLTGDTADKEGHP